MLNNHISSSEFATLCQSQIKLLSHSLGALWSVVYLTEEISEDRAAAQLFPFAIYPHARDRDVSKLRSLQLSEIWQGLQSHSFDRLLPDSLSSNQDPESAEYDQTESAASKQLILPLFHQETFIGLLIAAREDRDWRQSEFEQVEEIARTIAIARFLELQYHWTQGELTVQKNLRRVEHDRLDNLLHQLRNPLTALRTFGKLFLKRLLPDDRNRELAQSILAQSDRFQALLEQFEAETKLTTIDSPASDKHGSGLWLEKTDDNLDRSSFLLPSSLAELTSVDLKQVLEPLLNTATAIAAEREIELIDCIAGDIPKVIGDVSALREILNNLIDNAFKYTPAGGKVRLKLDTSKSSMLGIAIEDTGYGIPVADRERIFERHYRGIQSQSDIPGTGLGLAIARELIIKMQGEIEMISPNSLSENSSGTTFIVWLPIVIEQ